MRWAWIALAGARRRPRGHCIDAVQGRCTTVGLAGDPSSEGRAGSRGDISFCEVARHADDVAVLLIVRGECMAGARGRFVSAFFVDASPGRSWWVAAVVGCRAPALIGDVTSYVVADCTGAGVQGVGSVTVVGVSAAACCGL